MTETATTLPQEKAQTLMQAYLVLLMGVIAVSLAAIFIRFAQAEGVPSLLIAFSRLGLAALALTPFTLSRYWAELRRLRRLDILLAGASGFWLAVHFATWITSLELTSVLVSTVLVTTTPLWAAVLEWIFLKARLSQWIIIGLIVALVGGVLIAFADPGESNLGRSPLAGAMLALSAAVAMAIYLTIGRRLRGSLSLLPYIWLVYGCAAVILLIVVALSGIPVTGYSSEGYLWLVVLALVPQLIGHSSFNFALKYLPATYISIATQMEGIGSAIAAFFLFQEVPLPLQIVGSIALLLGVGLASWGQARGNK
jgi:drug/metabolite transporter (DMT)-like permease